MMMLLDAMQSVGLSAGGVGLLVAAIGYAMRRLADSRLRLADARVANAEARRVDAETRRTEAQTERSEAERSIADGETIVALLAEQRRMRDEHRSDIARIRGDVEACRASHARTDERLARAISALAEMRRWAERVSREMQRRGMTPPEMPAVLAMEVE